MHDFINPDLPQTQSYKSIYELIGASEVKNTYGNHKQSIKHVDDLLVLQSLPGNVDEKSASNNSEMLNETNYVTSERYHMLNRKSSDKSVIRSTSTFFYDLDALAKRHSYHCVTDIWEENNIIQRKSNNVFKNYKSAAIVQECATQIKPKLVNTNNAKENKKKPERKFPNDTLLSSEIFLRDNEKINNYYKSPSDNLSVNKRHQKFWSFAKYRTEYTNPVSDETKLKKKDRGKRTEDPCPCQLFSYACPCTNSKSLTELAKNSKSLTVADEITNTPETFSKGTKCNKHKTKKINDITTLENKRTSTIDIIDKKSIEILPTDARKQNISNNFVREKSEVIANTMKIKGTKRPRQIVCPHCKEIIDVISTTEEEQNLKSNNYPLYRDKQLTSAPAYSYKDSRENSKMGESRDICNHEPQCELIPVCQILPTDNIYVNQNMASKTSPLKPTPKVLRITKGCRHHPPCTVVPSCQRINVLNNNCEYIPPCLHRPRCVNLPLCAPISKSVYYDEPASRGEEDVGTTDCLHHTHHNRCMTSNHNDTLENQINRVQNTCEFLSECSPRFVVNPTLGCMSPLSSSPCQMPYPNFKHCKSEKSCQFDFLDWNPNIVTPVKTSFSNEDVIFIRDVGCQFRNKNYSPKDSLVRDNGSCGSFDAIVNKYSTNYHTLRYKDKFTIPLSGEDFSGSTGTITSTDVNSKCPAHGRQSRDSHNVRLTGFVPISNISPYVEYSNTYPTTNFCLSANANFKEKNNISSTASINVFKKRQNVFIVKSRNSFFRGKYKNVLKRKRKSKTNHQMNLTNVS